MDLESELRAKMASKTAKTRIVQNIHFSLGHLPTFFWVGSQAREAIESEQSVAGPTPTYIVEDVGSEELSENDPSPRPSGRRSFRGKEITILYR